MPTNIEIKARISDVRDCVRRLEMLGAEGPTLITQNDTFFRCDTGRLKLRDFENGKGELIYYRRPDHKGPKKSSFVRTPTSDPKSLRESLCHAYGEVGHVRKRRMLFLIGRTRVHLDQVEDLGDFLELEVVLGEDEPPEAGIEEAERLMAQLGLAPSQLVECAYLDLLLQKGKREE